VTFDHAQSGPDTSGLEPAGVAGFIEPSGIQGRFGKIISARSTYWLRLPHSSLGKDTRPMTAGQTPGKAARQ
jgi:hypothetical protein